MDPARPSQAVTPEEFGPYEVYERLGMGGMASVHRAKKRGPAGFERTVALKRMLTHLTEDRTFVDSFVREAKVASLLAHPNIAQVYDFGRINGTFYIAMELVGGFDLRKLLRHAHKTNEPIPLPVVLSILAELCEALDYAHSFIDETGQHLNIVHRDISPSNLIISPMGHVKVIDFGIAKASGRQLHTETGSVKGKLGYMAPEVALGMQVGPVSDIFSVGVVAWELVTAMPLFSARTDFETMRKLREEPVIPPSRHNSTCPALLDQIIQAALSREPELRLASARAFRTTLDQVAQQQGIQINARAVAEWMRSIQPAVGEPVRMSASSARSLPLPAGPETQVSRPSAIGRASGGIKLRRSDEEIALATEIWGDDATHYPADSGQDFSMAAGGYMQGTPSQSYAQSLPATPYGQQIPSIASSGRVAVIAPSQAGFPLHPSQVHSLPPLAHGQTTQHITSRSKTPLFVLAGLAIVAGILGGVLYAKKSSTTAAAAPAAEVHFVVEPQGASIEVAGKLIGNTSPLDTELAPGVYSVTVKHPGFKAWTTSITLRDGEKQTINVALQGEPTQVVAVNTPPTPTPPTPTPTEPVAQTPDPTPETPETPDPRPDHKSGKTGGKDHHHTAATPEPPPEETKVVEPAHVEPAHVDPPKVDPPKVDPPKVDPPRPVEPVVDSKPKTTPVVAASAVTKLAGEVPILRGKSGDSSDVLVKMCIDERGAVTSATVKKSPPEIAGDLQRALLGWKYKPYTNRDSKLSPVCFPLQIRVVLKQ